MKPSLLLSLLYSFLLLGVSSCSLSEVGNTIKSKTVQGSNYLVEKSKGAYNYTKEVIGLGDDEPVDPSILYLKGKEDQGKGRPLFLFLGMKSIELRRVCLCLPKFWLKSTDFPVKFCFLGTREVIILIRTTTGGLKAGITWIRQTS
jgi:hypothetical protein